MLGVIASYQASLDFFLRVNVKRTVISCQIFLLMAELPDAHVRSCLLCHKMVAMEFAQTSNEL